MLLFVGLGNPGREHAKQRHNIGFMAVDRIAEDHGFSPWREKFQGQVSEGRLGAEKVLLLKPQTYMNLSGQSVGAALRFHKIEIADVVVFHDELDLAPGKLRVKHGGGHAGHNGLRSIHQHCPPEAEETQAGPCARRRRRASRPRGRPRPLPARASPPPVHLTPAPGRPGPTRRRERLFSGAVHRGCRSERVARRGQGSRSDRACAACP